MERVTFILHVSLMVLVGTAGAIFALAEGRTGIPAVTIPVAIVACFLVDHYRLWRLSTGVQNLLGLAAFAAAGVELYLSDIEAPLLAGGHLLSYLTCAFLLQPKGRRQFWWLTALCVLQVAVSSVLTYESWFGLVMPVFLLELLWTMSVFQLQQAALAFDGVGAAAGGPSPAPAAVPWSARSSATRTAQLDEQHRWVTPRFALNMLTGTALSVLLALTFFIFIPRVWPNTQPIYSDGGRPIGGAPSRTGYTSRVTLGHVGEIQESARVALESQLFAADATTPADWSAWLALTGGEPRFRGVTQEVYDDGVWDRWEGVERAEGMPISEIPVKLNGGHRQRVRIYHQSVRGEADVVMSCGLPLGGSCADPLRELLWEPFSWSLASQSRRGAAQNVQYDLEVAPVDPWYPNLFGQMGPLQTGRVRSSQRYLSTAAALPQELRDQLELWIANRPELHPQSMSHAELAQRYERWFLEGTELTYSLNLSIVDPKLDPAMDFLTNTRRGNCEYFATALALLLRTYGIPTRVVTGYKGGQVGADGTLTVRDLHAHLWVEAYLADAPQNQLTGQAGPRWVTLDPTPAMRNSVVASQEQLAESAWGRLQTGWTTLWSQSIRMSEADQRALIFDPIREIAGSAWSDARAALRGEQSQLRRWLTNPRDWFSWQGGLIAFLLMMLGLGGYRGLTRLRRSQRSEANAANESGPHRVDVPFYRRLESLLAEQGVLRRTSDTPREFVAAMSPDWEDRVSPQLRPLPEKLTERFYAVRFGHAPLADDEAAGLDRQLDELERELHADALRRASIPG